jgi:hypothetical protein
MMIGCFTRRFLKETSNYTYAETWPNVEVRIPGTLAGNALSVSTVIFGATVEHRRQPLLSN